MASRAFKSPASSPLALPSESPHGNALPPIIDHEAARVIAISQQSADVAITAFFESELPRNPELLLLEDLLSLSAEALGAEIAATWPEFAAYSSAFVSAGFGGAGLSSYAGASDSDLEQLLKDMGIDDASHRQRLISELRLLRSRYAALEVPPLQLLPLLYF